MNPYLEFPLQQRLAGLLFGTRRGSFILSVLPTVETKAAAFGIGPNSIDMAQWWDSTALARDLALIAGSNAAQLKPYITHGISHYGYADPAAYNLALSNAVTYGFTDHVISLDDESSHVEATLVADATTNYNAASTYNPVFKLAYGPAGLDLESWYSTILPHCNIGVWQAQHLQSAATFANDVLSYTSLMRPYTLDGKLIAQISVNPPTLGNYTPDQLMTDINAITGYLNSPDIILIFFNPETAEVMRFVLNAIRIGPTAPQAPHGRQWKSATGTTSAAVTITAPVAGNLLIAFVASSKTSASVSIDGTGWSSVITQNINIASQNIFWKVAGASEPTTITASTSSGTYTELVVMEYQGFTGTITLDENQFTADTGVNVTSRSTGITGVTDVPIELVLGVVGVAGAIGSPSWTGGLTARVNTTRQYIAEKVTAQTGTYSGTLSWTTALRAAGMILSFKSV